MILQGPYFHVGNPFSAERNETMSSNLDYSALDLEVLPASAIPATEYKPLYETYRAKSGEQVESTVSYDTAYGWWQAGTGTEGDPVREVRVRDHFRVMWRRMAATTGERTLIPAIYPPATAHVHPVHSIGFPDAPASTVVLAEAAMSSLLSDFVVRSTVSGDIFKSAVDRLPSIPFDHSLFDAAILRTLRLNALTTAYADRKSVV